MNIYLIGFMGSGKSFALKQLSKKYFSFDTDYSITKITGLSISEIFQIYSEEKFRKIEKILINEISYYKNLLVATGGGVLERNYRLLKKSCISIFLDAQLDILWQRTKLENIERPKAVDYDSFRDLYHKRLNKYKKAANYTVNTEEQFFVNDIEKIVDKAFFKDLDSNLQDNKNRIDKIIASTSLKIKEYLDENLKNKIDKNNWTKRTFIFIDIVSYILFFSGNKYCIDIGKNGLESNNLFFFIPIFGCKRNMTFPEYFIIKSFDEKPDKLSGNKISSLFIINNIYRSNRKILKDLLNEASVFSFIEFIPDIYISNEYKDWLTKFKVKYLHLS
jgi:shikimate kinase